MGRIDGRNLPDADQSEKLISDQSIFPLLISVVETGGVGCFSVGFISSYSSLIKPNHSDDRCICAAVSCPEQQHTEPVK